MDRSLQTSQGAVAPNRTPSAQSCSKVEFTRSFCVGYSFSTLAKLQGSKHLVNHGTMGHHPSGFLRNGKGSSGSVPNYAELLDDGLQPFHSDLLAPILAAYPGSRAVSCSASPSDLSLCLLAYFCSLPMASHQLQTTTSNKAITTASHEDCISKPSLSIDLKKSERWDSIPWCEKDIQIPSGPSDSFESLAPPEFPSSLLGMNFKISFQCCRHNPISLSVLTRHCTTSPSHSYIYKLLQFAVL